MNNSISRQVAIDLLDNLIGMVDDNHGSDYDAALRMGIEALRAKPISARRMYQIGYDDGKKDAFAEPVRCKNCKHLFDDNMCPLRTWWTHTEDDFCSYGKRRQDATS